MNKSTVNEFLLMGISDDHNMQVLHSVTFLIMYLTALIGNILIMTAVALDHQLHSPMYFFLFNLSLVDLCYISTTVPKSIEVSLTNNRLISYAGCVTQIYSVTTFAGEELALLTIMAYDRYVAICHPLRYRLIMNWEACIQMVAASWASNLTDAVLHTVVTSRLNFCGQTMVDQFFFLLTSNKLISYAGCVTQIFLVATFAGEELVLLTIMAYDRYVAICHPLRYRLIMTWKVCIQMAAASWASNLIHAMLHTIVTFRLNFCRRYMIGQFFCDIPQLQKISCSDTKVNQVLIFVFGISMNSFCSTLIIVSYGYIFSTVMKIPSDLGRSKAFSTCTPHLTVFSLFIVTAGFSYMRPKSLSFPTIDLWSAILYAVLPPVLNPIIYSLRNKEIQKAVGKINVKMKNFLSFWKNYACIF
uniref:G-protein coupled receptors family 1 profile domain-containing protein n=1 Tax=Salvator merianae TaxID=96440 RepID=A0A8D0E6G4_SALMN